MSDTKFITDLSLTRFNEWLIAYSVYLLGQLTATAIGVNSIITEDEENIVTDENGITIIEE